MPNPEMQQAFVAAQGSKPSREPKPKPPRQRRSPIKPVSVPMAEKKARWAFIKKCMVLAQRRTNGFLSCMQCGAVDPWKLDLDHIDAAGHGGIWEPENAQLLCRTPDHKGCHDLKHGVPSWSGAPSESPSPR